MNTLLTVTAQSALLVENIGTFVNEAVKLKGEDMGLTSEQMYEGNRYIPSLRDEWKKLRNDSRFDVASERRTAELYFPGRSDVCG